MNEAQNKILEETLRFAIEEALPDNDLPADAKAMRSIHQMCAKMIDARTFCWETQLEAMKTQVEVVKDASAKVLAKYLITIGDLEREISEISAKTAAKVDVVRSEADMAHEWLTNQGLADFNGRHRLSLIKRMEALVEPAGVEALRKWLDDRGVPKKGPNDQVYTLIGRVEHYKFSMPRTGKNPMIEEAILAGEDTSGLCTVREAIEVMRENKSNEMELFFRVDDAKYNVIISYVEVVEGA